MKLYLMQHGEAKSEEEDPERHLTENGKKEVDAVAARLEKAGISPALIIHSGKARARETAEITGKRLNPEEGVKESENLKPLDDPKKIAEVVEKLEKDLMIVGHLPHLSKLCSLLLVGDKEKELVKFRMGGVVCLEKKEGWQLRWFIVPELS